MPPHEETLEGLAAGLEMAGVALIQAALPVNDWAATTAQERAGVQVTLGRSVQALQEVARTLESLNLPPAGAIR